MINTKPILFGEERVGRMSIGTITFNRPEVLNSLNTECYELIVNKLKFWESNEDIAMVVVNSSGDQAFCAGGDVKALSLGVKKSGIAFAKSFFTAEYFTDCYLRNYPKPILAVAKGLVMGGGLGFLQGCSHRAVTFKSILSMPEISIGLFPDVGATQFLGKIKNHFGLFMGLTGARISSHDAIEVGLADHLLQEGHLRKIHADLIRLPWQRSEADNHQILTDYLLSVSSPDIKPEGCFAFITELADRFESNDLQKIHELIENLETKNPFLVQAKNMFLAGSPLSKKIFFSAYMRHRGLDIKEALINEWDLSIRSMKETEFHEGVRALLIDKDKAPKWSSELYEKAKNDIAYFFKSDEENDLAKKFSQVGF